MSFSRLFHVLGRQIDSARAASQRVSSSSTRGSAMKTTVFVLLFVVALSACAPAIVAAPTPTSIPATSVPPTAMTANTAIPSPEPIASPTTPAPWSLVAVGDEDVYTSALDRYAAAITQATGHPVKVQNLATHSTLQIEGLLGKLKNDTRQREALANADIIVVGIEHNGVAWGRDDDPCDGVTPDQPDWSKYNATCAAAAAEILRPKFESVYAQIVALRAGKPTLFRTINHYNDWVGTINADGSQVPPEATNASRVVLDAYSAMICKAAQTSGFACADIYHAFNGPDGLTLSGDLLLKDNTHPSDKGNEVIARVLADLGYAPLGSTVAPPMATSLPAISAAASQVKATTLRLAVTDAEGRPSDPYVREFIEQVKTLSGGQLVIEPVWSAGDDTDIGHDRGVIQHLIQGDDELGLTASRAWDVKKYPNLQPLQAPFLITNDALAIAVAQSDSAKQMLDSLSSGGMVGLTLWPEDLRHPFSIDPAKPLVSPAGFKGLTIRTPPSDVSYQLISALGGRPMFEDSGYEGAESGLLQGGSLIGQPAATGNVTFFPKFQMLFASAAAFDKLSEDQRTILRNAAAATQKKALAEHPSEVEAAQVWCAAGGTVVLASAEQVAAFEKAAQPVLESIEQDPTNAKLIAAIRDLKSKTTASPGAAACKP